MKRSTILGAALALVMAPVQAAPFTLFIYETSSELALRSDPSPSGQNYWAAYAELGAAMQKAGVLRGGSALDTAVAPVVLGRAGADGAAGLKLGGYFLIDVADAQAARDWALKVPAAQSGSVMIIPGIVPPGMN